MTFVVPYILGTLDQYHAYGRLGADNNHYVGQEG